MKKYTSSEFLLPFSYYWSLWRMVVTGTFSMFSGIPMVALITFFHPIVIALYQHLWVISGAVSLYLLIQWFNSDRTYFGKRGWHEAMVFWVVVVTGINRGLHAFDAQYNVKLYEFVFGDRFFIALGAVYFYFAFQWWMLEIGSKIPAVKIENEKGEQ